MRRVVITVALAAAVGLVAVVPAWARSSQATIDETKQTLEALKQTIETTRQQRDQSRKDHSAVLESIERLDRQLHKERDEADAATQEIAQLDRELRTLRAGLAVLQTRLDARKARLATRLRRRYMEGPAAWFRPLLGAESYAQFQRRIGYLSRLAEWEHQGMAEYRRDMAAQKARHARRVKARDAWVATKSRVEHTLRSINDVKSEKKIILAGFAKRTQSHDDKLAALKQAENRKESLLNALSRRGRMPEADDATRAPGVFRKGALLWPADGALVGAFGRQKHPTFDTYVERKGIEIAARAGMDIRAVSGGTVVYADWLKGYGLVVILDHGAKYFTFYAHASKLLVDEGDAVARGAVLGKTGASGVTDRVVLYFELRKGTKPVNPLGWFATR